MEWIFNLSLLGMLWWWGGRITTKKWILVVLTLTPMVWVNKTFVLWAGLMVITGLLMSGSKKLAWIAMAVVLIIGIAVNRPQNNLIFGMPEIEEKIVQYQNEARYLPYKLRLLVFNQTVYLWSMARNIFNYWSLFTLIKGLAIINLPALGLGIGEIIKRREYGYLGCLLSGSIALGVCKMVDTTGAMVVMWPAIFYILVRGWEKIW